ncbi:MAG: DUF2550 domain-containing protein [Nocardioidaceae bacterium]
MPWEWVAADFVVLLVAVAVALPLGLVLRRRWIARRGSVFELSVNPRRGSTARGWTLGLGSYRDDRLEWFRFFSFSPRPKRIFARSRLEVVDRRAPHGAETFAIYSGHVVVECRDGSAAVQLALAQASLTALLAWLESAPPGINVNQVV